MHIKDLEKFKEWLLKKLEPLFDADPAALAKYVVALLKKDKPRAALKELCIDQLEVFLAKETSGFVEGLFRDLETESYLNGGVDSGNMERTVSEDHSKREEVDDEDRDFRRSRRSDSDEAPHRRVTTSTGGLGRKRRMDASHEQAPPIRRRVEYSANNRRPVRERLGTRQDDNRSDGRRRYRSRSRSSSYSDSDHSTDSDRRSRGRNRKRYSKNRSSSTEDKKKQRCADYDEKGVCILGESCPYDHGIDPLVIGGNEIAPFAPPALVMPPHSMSGPPRALMNVSEGYNPEDPALSSTKTDFMNVPMMLPMGPRFPPMPPMPGVPLGPPLGMPPSLPPRVGFPPSKGPPFPRPFMGRTKPSDTVIVRKIPRDMNTITKISSHFEKFGTVVNVKVHYERDPESALVQFSAPIEATRAHNSTEAVFNNRFIKVYYLRLSDTPVTLETPASVTTSVGAPSDHSTVVSSSDQTTVSSAPAPDSSNPKPRPSRKLNPPKPQLPSGPPPHVMKRQQKKETEDAKKCLELQKLTQQKLQKQIEQQKELIARLERSGKTLPAEQKSKIIATLKSLSANISNLKEAASAVKKKADSIQSKKQLQADSESLKKEVLALRKEAQGLGLLKPSTQPPKAASGKGHFKPKPQRKIIVIGATDRMQLTGYFESFGNLEQVEIDPANNSNLIFTFKNAYSANKAVKSGSVFNGQPLIMKWYSPKSVQPQLPPVPVAITSSLVTPIREDQASPVSASALERPDPTSLHLAEDSDDDHEESRSWKH